MSLDDMKVYKINTSNQEKTQITDYTVSFYQDATKIPDISGLKAGRYQIWVDAKVDETKTLSTFEFVYIDAHLRSIKVNDTVGKFTQKAGKDIMTDTWTFTVTYSNGSTRIVDFDTLGMSYDRNNFSTNIAGSYDVLVTYTEENNDSRQVLVHYVIN